MPQLYEAERAAGRTLAVEDVIELLTRITEELPEAPGMPGLSGAPGRLTGN